MAERVTVHVAADLAIGIELLDASVRSCAICVQANAQLLKSAAVAGRVSLAAAQHQAGAAECLKRIRALLAPC